MEAQSCIGCPMMLFSSEYLVVSISFRGPLDLRALSNIHELLFTYTCILYISTYGLMLNLYLCIFMQLRSDPCLPGFAVATSHAEGHLPHLPVETTNKQTNRQTSKQTRHTSKNMKIFMREDVLFSCWNHDMRVAAFCVGYVHRCEVHLFRSDFQWRQRGGVSRRH